MVWLSPIRAPSSDHAMLKSSGQYMSAVTQIMQSSMLQTVIAGVKRSSRMALYTLACIDHDCWVCRCQTRMTCEQYKAVGLWQEHSVTCKAMARNSAWLA